MEPIKIIIVDDHTLLRKGLSQILKEYKHLEVIGEAADGKEFLKLLNSLTPDIVFMDIKMPNLNGIEATKEALIKNPALKIIALSMHEDEEYVESMIHAGAKGFILKKAGVDELLKAIEVVSSGGNYYSSDILSLFTKKINAPKENDQILLNAREKEVLKLLCKGFSTLEIAEQMLLSPRTIESYRTNLLEKTNSKNTISLVLFAIKNHIVSVMTE